MFFTRLILVVPIWVGLFSLDLVAWQGQLKETQDPTLAELLKKAVHSRILIESNCKKAASLDKFLAERNKATQSALVKMAELSVLAVQASTEWDLAKKTLSDLNESSKDFQKSKQLASGKEKASKKAQGDLEKQKDMFEILARANDETEKVFLKQIETLISQVNEAAAIEAVALGGLKPMDARLWSHAKARHLLTRAGFGGTPGEIDTLAKMGLHLAVEFLLEYQQQPNLNISFDSRLPESPLVGENFLSPMEKQNIETRRRSAEANQLNNLKFWWLQRMAQSQRPLQEKMVLFWHGHFTSEHRVVQSTHAMYRQNEFFRENALGNFSNLLHGIIHDPAMLRYLDNNSNIKGKPNENLARELMELFSLGEGNGYTEKDIMEGARALTGLAWDYQSSQFRFIANNHDQGSKSLFGKTGSFSGDEFVDLILQQPASSRYLAGKLYSFFARHEINRASAERMASVLRRSQFEIKPVLRNLFLSEEFYQAETQGSLVKSPIDLLIGYYRETGQKENTFFGMDAALRTMGQELFNPPNVKGWEGGRAWINSNSLVTRFNQMSFLVERPLQVPIQPGQRPVQTQLDIVALLSSYEFSTPTEVVNHLTYRHLIAPLDSKKKEEFVKFISDLPGSREWEKQKMRVNAKLRSLLSLMLGSPEYQLH